jgi:CRP-like cAMP-binding protein
MVLKDIVIFKGIDAAIVKEIQKATSDERHPKGALLFDKGDLATDLYVLKSGVLNLVIKNGGTLTFMLSEPGEVFGWSSMLDEGRYTAAGVCGTDLEIARIPKEKLEKIFAEHPKTGYTVLKRVAGVISKRLSHAYRDLLSARYTAAQPSYG